MSPALTIVDWLDTSKLRDQLNVPLFQTFATRGPRLDTLNTGFPIDGDRPPTSIANKKFGRALSGNPMTQAMTWEMIQRRTVAAGIETAVCNHTFRATGITAYLSNGGTIERAAVIAGHASTRTTQLYDRRPDDVTLEEIERIRFA